ncbi:MAG TPA: ATP-binding protein [Methylibium sp.]|nr:ATP-binding protein [Methylibium sp.]
MNARRAAAALALALGAALAACGKAPPPPGAAAGAVVELHEALLAEGHSERPVTLPDAWEASAPARAGRVRYRLELPDAALHAEQSALYIPRAGNALRLQVNGQPLLALGVPGDDGRLGADTSRTPLWLPLPPALLRPSGNRMEIELYGDPKRDAGLAPVWVGPLAELEPRYRARLDHEVQGAWVVSAAATVMGVLALLLAARAGSFVYACFGAASLLWAWRLTGPPEAGVGAWSAFSTVLFHASYAWFVVLMSLYALAAVGRDSATVRRVQGAWASLALALAAAVWLFNAPGLRTLLLGGTLAGVLWLFAVLAVTAWRQRTPAALLLAAAAGISVAVGARDFMVFRVFYDYGALAWSRYTILLLLAVLAWLLVDEFARSATALRSLNADLKERVARKERELTAAFAQTREREREQAALAERDRILREMHDGLGGRLVAALALTSQLARQSQPPPEPDGGERRGIEEPLRELKLTLDDCLVELRLALDSLEADHRPLIEALAELRFRVEPSLRAAGVRLVWQLAEAASERTLPAGDTLHVLRIVREALTNVLKHAQATVAWMRLELREDGGLTLKVVDNGLQQRAAEEQPPLPLFVPASMAPGGRGLANMQRRAAALGAWLESGPDPEGWAVTLALPAPEAPPQAQAG